MMIADKIQWIEDQRASLLPQIAPRISQSVEWKSRVLDQTISRVLLLSE